MRILIKIFAVLDLISIILLFTPVLALVSDLQGVPANFSSQARVWLTFPLFLSLVASATGLYFHKKYGPIIYFAQFPFRLVLWFFSIGFITFLPEWLNLSSGWFDAFFKICIVAEFFRLYFTMKIYQKYF